MGQKARTARDPFAFSLGGLTAIAAFVPPPVVASDRIRTRRQRHAGRPSPASAQGTPEADKDCVSAA
ncbi:hypothetical protein [Thioalkalivibrio sp. XN8]|uniref:hypothetical protein n=1 Tax=Thioalkalivibrio sp. XN8 TaxID=2712863 RepID=UPI0013ED65AA|nr:hypothetical protein [Thioalkalivibrio sp. XN8]NGP54431.1 hypothetical protein [Thioalkalivibrio sp. XN8]